MTAAARSYIASMLEGAGYFQAASDIEAGEPILESTRYIVPADLIAFSPIDYSTRALNVQCAVELLHRLPRPVLEG
jgi:hypothetical protein